MHHIQEAEVAEHGELGLYTANMKKILEYLKVIDGATASVQDMAKGIQEGVIPWLKEAVQALQQLKESFQDLQKLKEVVKSLEQLKFVQKLQQQKKVSQELQQLKKDAQKLEEIIKRLQEVVVVELKEVAEKWNQIASRV